jgi:uncharacterized protein
MAVSWKTTLPSADYGSCITLSQGRTLSTPLELVHRIYDAVGRGDLADVASRLSPGFVAEQNPALPFGGRWIGPAGFMAMGEAILAAYPGFAVEPARFHECGSAVLVKTRVRAPAADARQALDQAMFEYWEFADGRAIACRPFYADPAAAAASAVPMGEE